MLKKLVKKYTTKALRRSLRDVRTEFTINWLHQAGERRAHNLHGSEDLKLHFGCGSNIKAGYINIDLGKQADLRLDLREPIPFSTNSCSMIYSEHFLEHLCYPDEAMFFLNECSRVLKPGGLF